MATIKITSNAMSGDGSLDSALRTIASAGDTIVLDESLSTEAARTIPVGTAGLKYVPGVKISGSISKPIIFTAGSSASTYIMQLSDTSADAHRVTVFENCIFDNFYRAGNSTITVLNFYSSVKFINCIFRNIHTNQAASVVAYNASEYRVGSIIFENCLFYNDYVAVTTSSNFNGAKAVIRNYSTNDNSIVVRGCTFAKNYVEYSDKETGVHVSYVEIGGGNNGTTIENTIVFETSLSGALNSAIATAEDFVDYENNDFRLAYSSSLVEGGSLTGTDILGHSRKSNSSIGAYEGRWFVVNSTNNTISGNVVADYVDIAGDTLTVDSTEDVVLTVGKIYNIAEVAVSSTTDAKLYIGATESTHTALSDNVTGSVVVGRVGAGVTTLDGLYSGTNNVYTIGKTNVSIPVVVEIWNAVESGWEVADGAFSGTSYVTTSRKIRVFDGKAFKTFTVTVVSSNKEISMTVNVGYLKPQAAKVGYLL